jgi:hypothetical protein
MKFVNANQFHRKSGVRLGERGAPVQYQFVLLDSLKVLFLPFLFPRLRLFCLGSIEGGKKDCWCRFLSCLFDVPVESGIPTEGDNHAIHDADDPQGV